MTPNEHDNPTTAHEPEDGAEHADASDGQFGEHPSSGTDPAASAYPSEYPHETGLFPHLQPREFPHDESPGDESPWDEAARDEAGRDEFPPEPAAGLPVMEQLPDPDTPPDPGYPDTPGYQSAVSPLPPSAVPETEASWPFAPATEQRPAFRPPQYRDAEPYQAQPPESYLAPPAHAYSETADGYQEWPTEEHDQLGDSYSAQSQDPYLAPRSSAEAPPLPGSAGPLSDILGGARPEEAPPFPATQSQFPAAAPAFPSAAIGEPLSAPPSLNEPDVAEHLPGETAESLTTDVLLHGKRAVPGWPGR